VLALGVLSAASNCAFLVRAASGSRLDPVNSFISELEVPGQPASGFFRWASVLSGLLAVLFAVGLRPRLPPGRLAVAGCAALALFGLAGAVDALVPMDCAPSASVLCLRAEQDDPVSWLASAHTWFDAAGTVAVLASLWLLGRHLRGRPGWRLAAGAGSTGFVWLTLGSGVLAAMSYWYVPGLGVVQRLQVLAVSAWLVLLAAVQFREPDGAGPVRGPAGRWRAGEGGTPVQPDPGATAELPRGGQS
jgi:hypothetical protein